MINTFRFIAGYDGTIPMRTNNLVELGLTEEDSNPYNMKRIQRGNRVTDTSVGGGLYNLRRVLNSIHHIINTNMLFDFRELTFVLFIMGQMMVLFFCAWVEFREKHRFSVFLQAKCYHGCGSFCILQNFRTNPMNFRNLFLVIPRC